MPPTKSSSKAGAPSSGAGELNHHLVANRGFWWVCCSINATPRTKEKLGFSLGTKCLLTARLRRDYFLDGLHAEGLEVRIRRHSQVAIGALRVPPPERAALSWQARVEDVLAKARELELDAAQPVPAKKPAKARRSVCCV
jgi:hypothetical protein